MNISSNIKCPICYDNRNLEFIPIFESESEIIKNTVVIWVQSYRDKIDIIASILDIASGNEIRQAES